MSDRDPLTRDVYTVSEIVEQARQLLEAEFPHCWIEGEISNFKCHSSGHCYFTLKDAHSQLRTVMFRNTSRGLRFKLEDGLKVVVGGRLSIYTSRGDFQMVVETLEPAGWGALQLAFEQLKKKLAQEGLFDPQRKKSLPEFPRRIAVVTSPTGAAIQDILNVMARRSPWADISLYPVRVQGEGAAQEIAHALRRLNEVGGWDVIICGRGGGSLEDLWAFNEEIVARAIADSQIPIISAVGHEIDYTIADFVADVRAETPTAAAELVVKDRRELLSRLQGLSRLLASWLNDRLREFRRRLQRAWQSSVLQQPRRIFENLAQRLDDLSTASRTAFRHHLHLGQEQLHGRVAQLEALSPLKVLGRGYSLVYLLPQRRLIRKAKLLHQDDDLEIVFSQGKALCQVKAVKSQEGLV